MMRHPQRKTSFGLKTSRTGSRAISILVTSTEDAGLAKEMVVVHKGHASTFFLIENLEVILRNLIIFSLFNEFFLEL